MDEDHGYQPERLLSEAPPFQNQQQHERAGSMSLGSKPPIDDAPATVNGDAVNTEATPATQLEPQVNSVINSEVGGGCMRAWNSTNLLLDWSTNTAQSIEAEHRVCKGMRKSYVPWLRLIDIGRNLHSF